jgi:hypothetical protein
VVAGLESGKETGEVCRKEFAVCGGDTVWKGLQGDVGLEGYANAGENVEAVEEGGIKREAQGSEGVELGRVVGIAGGKHSGGGGGGFGERGGSIKHGDSHAAVVEFEGEGEADDAGPGDADVGVVHGISLVRCGEVIVCVRGCRRLDGLQSAG